MSKLGYTGRLLREFMGFAREKKTYWIVPLIVVLLGAATLIVATNTIAPLIYTLF
jgi:hypothetical protein